MTTPSGRLSNEPGREREEEKKMPFIVASYVYASSQGQRTHFARTNIENHSLPLSSHSLLPLFPYLCPPFSFPTHILPPHCSLHIPSPPPPSPSHFPFLFHPLPIPALPVPSLPLSICSLPSLPPPLLSVDIYSNNTNL